MNHIVYSPKRLDDALQLISREPKIWQALAGGTDIMVNFLGKSCDRGDQKFLNIVALSELRGILSISGWCRIGALTTFSELRNNHDIIRTFPMLFQAAESIGSVAIQNRATIGGNIANASPAADSSPVLLAYDAEIELVAQARSRRMPYKEFHTGYKKTALRDDELIAAIWLPIRVGADNQGRSLHYYRKVGPRKAQAISKISFAGWAAMAEPTGGVRFKDLRIAFGAVGPTAIRCIKTEDALRGVEINQKVVIKAKQILASEIAPIDDIRSSAEYRLMVSSNLLEDFIYSTHKERNNNNSRQ